jgi:ubiquitin-protein ligase
MERTSTFARDGELSNLTLHRSWRPVFDSTEYAHFGELLAPIKEEDTAVVSRLNQKGAPLLGGTAVTWGSPHIAARLFKELKIACTWANWISIAPLGDDINNCLASMEGPIATPYEGGVFWLHVQFPSHYPCEPPVLRFLTMVYHPNIARDGTVCLDVLDEKWTPALTIAPVLASVHLLLSEPEWSSPLQTDVARHFSEDRMGFFRKAVEWTELYAMKGRPSLMGSNEL